MTDFLKCGLSNNMLNRLGEHTRVEFINEMKYLDISNYFLGINCPNISSIMRKQSLEEREHGLKLIDYIYERRGSVAISPILVYEVSKPVSIESPQHAIELAFKEEEALSKMFAETAHIAEEEFDYATRKFLDWYLEEQVEEESTMETIYNAVNTTDNDYELQMIDLKMPEIVPDYF